MGAAATGLAFEPKAAAEKKVSNDGRLCPIAMVCYRDGAQNRAQFRGANVTCRYCLTIFDKEILEVELPVTFELEANVAVGAKARGVVIERYAHHVIVDRFDDDMVAGDDQVAIPLTEWVNELRKLGCVPY